MAFQLQSIKAKKSALCWGCEFPPRKRVPHFERREHVNTLPQSEVSPAETPAPPSQLLLARPPERDPAEILPWLPCTLALDLPVMRFKVRDLFRLGPGSIVETAYHQSSDLPLRVNGQLVGLTEFEVVGERLAVRLTDLT